MSYTCDQGSVSTIYKEQLQLSNKKKPRAPICRIYKQLKKKLHKIRYINTKGQ